MGLLRQDGTPKPAMDEYAKVAGDMGPLPVVPLRGSPAGRRRRLDEAPGRPHLRTGLSWADYYRPNALDWFDRQMEALADFDVTATVLLHPRAQGHRAPPHQRPKDPTEFADFCAEMVARYAPGRATVEAAA
jgi:hypothetical protein